MIKCYNIGSIHAACAAIKVNPKSKLEARAIRDEIGSDQI